MADKDFLTFCHVKLQSFKGAILMFYSKGLNEYFLTVYYCNTKKLLYYIRSLVFAVFRPVNPSSCIVFHTTKLQLLFTIQTKLSQTYTFYNSIPKQQFVLFHF